MSRASSKDSERAQPTPRSPHPPFCILAVVYCDFCASTLDALTHSPDLSFFRTVKQAMPMYSVLKEESGAVSST